MKTFPSVLFSAVKNEAPFLLEWVAYHRAIGFDRIVIVSNDSDDGTTELLDRLHEAGVVHHLHHQVADGKSPQGKAAQAANASGLIKDGDWVIWLDADEFLNIHAGQGKIDDLIAAISPARALLIPWRVFGDSGNDTFPGRFVSTDFTRAAAREFKGNQIIKTLFQHVEGQTRLSPVANHRPHLLRRKAYGAHEAVNAGGRPIDMSFPPNRRWIGGIEGKANFSIPDADYDWTLAQVNHYMLRTREMFNLKAYRGRGFLNIVKGKPVVRPRHTPAFFADQNRNDDEDTTILRHSPATTRELETLLDNAAIRDAHENGLRLTAIRIEEMQDEMKSQSEQEPDVIEAVEDVAEIEDITESAAPQEAELFVPKITMPANETAMLRKHYAEHDVILEYGSGGSTLLAAGQDHRLVMSVESDRAWSDNMQKVLRRDYPQTNIRMHWEDIGRTGKWGRPVNHKAWRKFHRYPQAVWDMPWFTHPDLILIDGRFRVGCLLTALYRIERPVTILFDDYTTRRHYVEAVEKFVQPVEIAGRMAQFEIQPTAFPVDRMMEITDLLSRPD